MLVSISLGGFTFTVLCPQSHVRRSFSFFGLVSRLQAGQFGRLWTGMVKKCMSLKSRIMSFPLRFSPMPVSSLMVSIACIVPTIPAVAPMMPRVSHVCR